MQSNTIELYNALIEAGVEKGQAKQAASAVVSREEAKHFATKADLTDMEARLQRFIFTSLVTQAVAIVSVSVSLVQLLD
jgi:hypothetical protein